MKNYLYNKRKQERAMSIFSLIFWVLNFVFLQLSVNMMFKVIYSGNTDWFEVAANKEALNDEFFLNRTELIMNTVIVILVAVVVFSVMTVILFRNVQLKNMLTQMGVYTVIGYSKKKIVKIAMLDVVVDMLIAFPISLIISAVAWKKIAGYEMISALLEVMGNSWWMDACVYVVCVILMLAAVYIYSMVFVNKSLKKGVSYMLGKGIV